MRQIRILISCFLFIFQFCSCGTGTVHVQGQLMCHGKPAVGEKIELWEKNFGFPDTLMVSDVTDMHGQFVMKGTIHDMFMKPLVYVYFLNYCEPAVTTFFMECGNSVKVFLPPEFVAEGSLPKNIFNLDDLEQSVAITEQVGLEQITHSVFSHKECRSL